MNAPIHSIWNGVERRNPGSGRRKNERRSLQERRTDPRNGNVRRKGISAYLRSLIKSRLGVDRRKITDQRTIPDRRQINPRSMLTPEELSDLLS